MFSDDKDPYLDIVVENQYRSFIHGLGFEEYRPYRTQIGGQGILLSLLDRNLPLSSRWKINFFHFLSASLSALLLSCIVLWFSLEFGLVVAIIVVITTIFSQWLVLFGRNLWWSLWAFYLPMTVFLFYLRSVKLDSSRYMIHLFLLSFTVWAIKCLMNGYEFITTVVIMFFVPVIYYALAYRIKMKLFLQWIVFSTAGMALAVFLSLFVLCIQISNVDGSLQDGVNHIEYSFLKRSHGNPESFPDIYKQSLKSNFSTVFMTYFKGEYFNLNNLFPHHAERISNKIAKIRYSGIIYMTLIVSVFLPVMNAFLFKNVDKAKENALLFVTWFSLLAPISWLYLFKAHSYIHTHLNFILWQMPFTLFAFALFGITVRTFVLFLTHNKENEKAMYEGP